MESKTLTFKLDPPSGSDRSLVERTSVPDGQVWYIDSLELFSLGGGAGAASEISSDLIVAPSMALDGLPRNDWIALPRATGTSNTSLEVEGADSAGLGVYAYPDDGIAILESSNIDDSGNPESVIQAHIRRVL